jgi:hypothetical protein
MGTPPPSVSTLRFVPLLPRSVGFLPTFVPPKGGFGHRAIHRQPLPVNPLQGVIVSQALFPQGDDDVRLHPLLETAMGRAMRLKGLVIVSKADTSHDFVAIFEPNAM